MATRRPRLASLLAATGAKCPWCKAHCLVHRMLSTIFVGLLVNVSLKQDIGQIPYTPGVLEINNMKNDKV